MASMVRSPLKCHGGKSYQAKWIRSFFPDHSAYIEPFCYGCSVILGGDKPSPVEVAGDINPDVIRFWRTIQAFPEQFVRAIRNTPYTQEAFLKHKERQEVHGSDYDPLFWAVGYMVRNRMSRGGLGKDFAWSDRLRGGKPGDVNGWETLVEAMPGILKRIERVQFMHMDACDAIRLMDRPGHLFYMDPPYVPSTRTHKKAYDYEMSIEDHAYLCRLLTTMESKVILSAYRNDLYDDLLSGWKTAEKDMPNHSGQGSTKQRRTEVLYMNF
jgi:DNA adenine methylase